MYFFYLHFDTDYMDIFGTQLGFKKRYTGTQIGYDPF